MTNTNLKNNTEKIKDRIEEQIGDLLFIYEIGTNEFDQGLSVTLSEFWLEEETDSYEFDFITSSITIRGKGTSNYKFSQFGYGKYIDNKNFDFEIYSVTKKTVKDDVIRHLELQEVNTKKLSDLDLYELYGNYEKGGTSYLRYKNNDVKIEFRLEEKYFNKLVEKIKKNSLSGINMRLKFMNIYKEIYKLENKDYSGDEYTLFIDTNSRYKNVVVGTVTNIVFQDNKKSGNTLKESDEKVQTNTIIKKTENEYNKYLVFIILLLILILIFK
jgi:hypothetical protein